MAEPKILRKTIYITKTTPKDRRKQRVRATWTRLLREMRRKENG